MEKISLEDAIEELSLMLMYLERFSDRNENSPVYRKNESGDPYCHSLPDRNADTGISFETSEASLKAGYLTIISSEKTYQG